MNKENCPTCQVIEYRLSYTCPYCKIRRCIACGWKHLQAEHKEELKRGFYGSDNPSCPDGFHPALNGKCLICGLVP